MKIENQICSFKQAIRLKKLGVVQCSLFHYVNNWATPNGYSIDDGQHIISVGEQHITRLAGRKRGVRYDPLYQTGRLHSQCREFRTGDEPF
mgnify:CR=1 FL=1